LEWKSQQGPRRILRWIWIYFLYYSGLILWAKRRIAAAGGIIVLTFHRVLNDQDVARSNSPPGMIVRRSTFEGLLRFVSTESEAVPLTAPVSCQHRRARPRVAITFDDGWVDTGEIAFPLAEQSKVPITVFVCPGLMGLRTPFWPERFVKLWRAASQDSQLGKKFRDICLEAGVQRADRIGAGQIEELLNQIKLLSAEDCGNLLQNLRGLDEMRLSSASDGEIDITMSWAQVGRIAGLGAQIGSHTQTHQILPKLTRSAVKAEVTDSKRIIEYELRHACHFFAFPNGTWSKQSRDIVETQGYSRAFINRPGAWYERTDPLLVPRVNIWEGSLVGPSGRFSPIVFQYSAFWRAYRAGSRKGSN
jgi:peptidoglycan/xylan/chitin deacetylase (PgdA/CDA1 family)